MLRHIVVATSLACLVGAVAPHQADAKEISKIKKFKGTRDQVRAACTGEGRELIEAADQTWCGDDKRGSWRRAWNEVVPSYAFPADVRRILHTTHAIEALNSKLRRAVRAGELGFSHRLLRGKHLHDLVARAGSDRPEGRPAKSSASGRCSCAHMPRNLNGGASLN